MLVSPNNDVSLRKGFEELNISSQVNCGFYSSIEKIKTSEPIEKEWMDDEEDCPPPDYAYRTEPEESVLEIEEKFDLYLQVLWDLHHPRYPQARRRQDKDISSDKDEEENLSFKYYSEEAEDFLESETSSIDMTEPSLRLTRNMHLLMPHLENFGTDNS